jgi:hypothetical protein
MPPIERADQGEQDARNPCHQYEGGKPLRACAEQPEAPERYQRIQHLIAPRMHADSRIGGPRYGSETPERPAEDRHDERPAPQGWALRRKYRSQRAEREQRQRDEHDGCHVAEHHREQDNRTRNPQDALNARERVSHYTSIRTFCNAWYTDSTEMRPMQSA